MAIIWLQFPDAAPWEFPDSIRRYIDDVKDWEYIVAGMPVFDITAATTIADNDSTEYLHIPVTAINEFDLSPVDPSEDNTVFPYVALLSMPEEPQETTVWHTANWLVLSASNTYYARLLIGSDGAIQAGPGDYSVWLQIGQWQGRAGVISFI